MQVGLRESSLPADEASGPLTRVLGEEPPYHLFILSSLGLALVAGFTLATIAPLSLALDWGWGQRYRPLVQAHGQIQVLGWVGLFIIGMAYRLMPRFSGRPLALRPLAWLSWAAVVASLLMRLVAQPAGEGLWQRTLLVGSGASGMIGALAFAAVVLCTLLHRDSRAGATGTFFMLGAAAYAVQAAIGLAVLVQAAQRGDDTVRPLWTSGLLHLQFTGFIVMFILGVASRAVPTFSGLPRPEASARALAVLLAAAVATFVAASLWVAGGTRSPALLRTEAASLAALGPLFLVATWQVGVFRPAANRLRPASQQHVWFIRSAFAWLAVAAGLAGYYGIRAGIDGTLIPQHGIDAFRHTIGVGVASMMIVGMAILVLPEFAIRRMHHPTERALPLAILTLLNTATALRVAAAVAMPHWTSVDRYWPMAAGGMLAESALLLFAVLFVVSMTQKEAIVASQVPSREG